VIFISYSWQDRSTVAMLLHLLKTQRVPHWVDSKEIDVRQPLRPQILAGLSQASAVAFFDTSASRESSWVRFELFQARAFSIPVVALRSRRSPVDIFPYLTSLDSCADRLGSNSINRYRAEAINAASAKT
jgi:hypothetical protein